MAQLLGQTRVSLLEGLPGLGRLLRRAGLEGPESLERPGGLARLEGLE